MNWYIENDEKLRLKRQRNSMQDPKQDILEYLQKIPKGKVMTYKSLGEVFGVHPRKIAMTMKYNKHPEIYPCYKIVSTSGDIWWYSWEWSVDGKIQRLENDGIQIENGKIDKKYFF